LWPWSRSPGASLLSHQPGGVLSLSIKSSPIVSLELMAQQLQHATRGIRFTVEDLGKALSTNWITCVHSPSTDPPKDADGPPCQIQNMGFTAVSSQSPGTVECMLTSLDLDIPYRGEFIRQQRRWRSLPRILGSKHQRRQQQLRLGIRFDRSLFSSPFQGDVSDGRHRYKSYGLPGLRDMR